LVSFPAFPTIASQPAAQGPNRRGKGGSGVVSRRRGDRNHEQIATPARNIKIGGLTAGTDFDRLAISGSATLNGALNISLINGLDLGAGRSFQVNFTATSLTLVTPP
jgi:hypothetical protein